MAGGIRIKISFEHVEPFWMFLDREECPTIINIHQRIQQRIGKVKVACLFLDGCLLPPDETSELLRDGDMVHATVNEPDDQTHHKKHRKRKHSVENDECSVSDNQTDPDVKKKQRKNKDKRFLDSGDDKGHKSKDKKQQKKLEVERKKNKDNAANDDADVDRIQGFSPPQSDNKVIDTQNKTGTEAVMGTDKTPETIEIMDSTPIPKADDSSVVKHKKKRRRARKKSGLKEQSNANESHEKALAAVKQTPAKIRIPEWQKSQNKKIVFSSEGESADEMRNNEGVADRSQDTSTSEASGQLEVSEYNSSFSESYPSTSLNITKGSVVQKEVSMDSMETTDDVMIQNSSMEAGSAQDVNAAEAVNGKDDASGNGSAETEQDYEWYREQQYQEKLAEEIDRMRPCPSAINKSLTPVHLYTGGRHQVIEPNLTEYLKMSPEERGATVPPYVTATRLPNGAMKYTRATPFKKPAPAPAKASPRATSKQQQEKKSSISCADNGIPEVRDGRSVSSTANGKHLAGGRETIVLTPLSREYSLFADLTAAPKMGDHIAYKVLEMGEDYTPGISDYKEAEVVDYDPSSQNVTVKILSLFEKKKTPGKFDIPEDNPPEEEVTLELSSMFEPKLISSN